MKISYLDIFDLPSRWIKASVFCGSLLAMLLSFEDDSEEYDAYLDNRGSFISVVFRSIVWFFKIFIAAFMTVVTALWALYVVFAAFNLANRLTEGFVLGPDWANPPVWLFLLLILPVPTCIVFLEFIVDAVRYWAKDEFLRHFFKPKR